MTTGGTTAVSPAGLFHIEADDGLTWRCQCCGHLKNHKMFRKDPDAPRRKLCKLYGDVLTMYGITCKEFWDRYETQEGRCAICRSQFPSVAEIDNGGDRAKSGPVVDPDHDCVDVIGSGPKRCCKKCVRGLLCPGCNTLEGFVAGARASPLYHAVIEYQDQWRAHRYG